MTFRRGVPLVPTVARLVQLTGAQDLKNLEASGELKLPDVLVTASDGIFDRLASDGIDPGALVTPEAYERAVAFTFLGILAAQSYLDGKEDASAASSRYFALADRFYEQVRPRAGRSGPRAAGDGLPIVRNLDSLF